MVEEEVDEGIGSARLIEPACGIEKKAGADDNADPAVVTFRVSLGNCKLVQAVQTRSPKKRKPQNNSLSTRY